MKNVPCSGCVEYWSEVTMFAPRSNRTAETGATSQEEGVLEVREQLERVACEVLEEVERALHPVRGPRLDLGAHHEFPAVGLRDVHVHLRGHDYDVKQRLDGLGHARLE